MNLKCIKALAKFEFRVNFMSPMNFIVLIVLYPFIFFSNMSNVPIIHIKDLLIMFILLQIIISTVMQVPLKQALNREDKVVKRLIVTPTTKFDYIISGLVVQFISSSIAFIIMMLLAHEVMDIKTDIYYLIIALLFFVPMYLYSFVVAQLVNDPQAQKAIGMVSFLIFSVALGAERGILSKILYLIPFREVENLFNYVTYHNQINLGANLIIILIYSIIYAILSIKLFKWE
ncbi:MAG: ABC transporter permease [Mycoplasmatales bacterium]